MWVPDVDVEQRVVVQPVFGEESNVKLGYLPNMTRGRVAEEPLFVGLFYYKINTTEGKL